MLTLQASIELALSLQVVSVAANWSANRIRAAVVPTREELIVYEEEHNCCTHHLHGGAR